jgi:hypothetical protein
MPWELVAIQDGGRTLVVHYVAGNGGVIAPVGFLVAEQPDYVELTAVSVDPGGVSGDLGMRLGFGVIALSEPLGGRTLLHAPTSADFKLPGGP